MLPFDENGKERLWQQLKMKYCGYAAFCPLCDHPNVSLCDCAKMAFFRDMSEERFQMICRKYTPEL